MYTLWIGNKNYSSWSLRAWLALRVAGIAFQEQKLALFTDSFSQHLGSLTPAGLVPVLRDGDLVIWDSLAICEYAAEQHPDRHLWPACSRARARARSLASQMHSGFTTLRTLLPMNIEAHLPNIDIEAAKPEIACVQTLWQNTRAEFGDGGPFLFGRFSIADAFFAPVVSRFTTYGVAANGPVRNYMDAIQALPAMREWTRDALAEATFVAQDEPYRSHR
ncbi:glutathione S-transferase family protein [Bordetella avium]|uniref:glutathione S-transferase family protein n=1 Tax=Bordetella avium TaxID=521 RepID=UPI000E0BC831|nr:glutathione S-transferase family protein [Bordetella avium]AZY47758.1 glutathione S-transferase [Bordetella avium]AZY51127.1 glutathione S-transferase [Bordetella avium]RIQ15016.1 glutathione S-transferase family protein [Bordetella avium]RIQ18493.1 glutathione S-transferase family protein [Bordetella avium]RIQ35471.1 glutathione S-transferase family protein [Bordetella avium]